ncbi:MAG TPA: prenyltransferase/squalene oxidase repeat-containing protein [Actinomycetota bacterium]|nr:prenyltransferase/squalene oxidase repeat-containing protein [Actinomycetota bacterium]
MSRLLRASVAVAMVMIVAPLSLARAEPGPAAASAAAWVADRQAADGGFFGSAQPADATAETIASLAAAGTPAARSAIGRALGRIRADGPSRASRPAYAGRIVMGLVAAGRDPRSFDGTNYVARITAGYSAASSTYETGVYANALAILGLVAAREPVPSGAVTYMRANQCSDGGFAHDPGCVPRGETDSTSIVVCALAGMGVGRDDLIVSRAREWLRAVRAPGGGWPHFPGGPVNANSTGLALSALACLGERDAASLRVLRSLQMPSGGIRYDGDDAEPNSYATVQSIPGLAGRGYPVRPATAVAGTKESAVPSPPSPAASSRAPAPAGVAAPAASPAGSGSPSSRPAAAENGPRNAPAALPPSPRDDGRLPPAVLASGLAVAGVAAAFAGARVPAAVRRRRHR